MATSDYQLSNDNGSYSPFFEKKLIEEKRKDGYWIEAFKVDNQNPIGLIGYGLSCGEVNFYPNPCTTTEPGKAIRIQDLPGPVAMDQADITGNGINDIIICYQYGNTMVDCDPTGGKIIWLQNPGQKLEQEQWISHYIGRSTAMHRLKVGHFTQNKRLEIIGLPIVNEPYNLLAPVPVLLFQQPNDVLNTKEWPCEIIDKEFFHLIHDAKKINTGALDNLLIASREGINWLYFDEKFHKWTIEHIGEGEQEEKRQTTYYGSGCVDAGKVGNDSFAYIPTVEPFHGNVVAVYIKSTDNYLKQIQWKRYVLDVYGCPNEHGEGPAHHIVCADFDKDGDDEFLVALRGPSPNQGVYYYKPIDLSCGLFAKWKVSSDSAARIAVADFDNDGLLDFATISYYVPGYYEAENPSINIYYNRFANKRVQGQKEIQVTKQSNKLLFKVPRPNKALKYETLPFTAVGGIALSLEVIPPCSSRQVSKNTYIKVLSGVIKWTSSATKSSEEVHHSRMFLCAPKSVASLEIQSNENRLSTGKEGAILLVLKMDESMKDVPQFDSIGKVTIENTLPEYCSDETRKLGFQFVKCDKYEWGKDKFKGLEFYNLTGFIIDFADNDEHLCHMQMWAAGQGVNCGVRNLSDTIFCEVHACIVNGTGQGGIQYLRSSKEEYDPLTTPDSKFENLPVPSFYEHGPIWDIDAQKKTVFRENGTVVYPWHKWQSGNNGSSIQSFDIWITFEFDAQLSALP
ncbi:unnamed protein product [Rotaria socialis]|uniref:Aldos-2-ulose dehydratase/isomerase (AUDH) Cupin domain-containing protein n=2 Tax=Rotaria socialis TaxID=392032 RepID=A0A818VAV5_9BILA|nr:unnamed protein product [Rotaria socialis]CAF4557649.1 unnamed protein product [Rotaria socialis]